MDEGNDEELIAGLRAGDEGAFATLIERHHAAMVRVARGYVRDEAVAEEVAQDAWEGVLKGIHRFEGRSSLKTWIFRILTNTALTRAKRDRRSVPFSALPGNEDGQAPDADSFDQGGSWAARPAEWELPDEQLLGDEVRDLILRAIDELPDQQRAAITLRDLEGLDSDEASEVLGVTPGNERVLLHRARAKVRQALDEYLRSDQ